MASYEWGFAIVMAILCVTLSGLQYQWTGELGRAELARLRASLSESAQGFCQALDRELAAGYQDLLPEAAELLRDGRDQVHLRHYQKWLASKPRPIFSRLAVVAREGDGLALLELDQKSGYLKPADWPANWSRLRESLTMKSRGGGPKAEDRNGTLVEFPIFGRGAEVEWMIFELDLNYARNSWLPALLRTSFSPALETSTDIKVKTVSPPVTIIYERPAAADGQGGKVVSIPLNWQGRVTGFRWMLEARRREGPAEAAILAARRRTLALGVVLNVLMLSAALSLLTYTRRSRRLVETRMRFVNNVSHELRTPLTVIRGAAHNLSRGVVKDRRQVEEYAGLITQHAEQLSEMVEQVLELESVRKKRVAALEPAVDVAKAVTEAVAVTAEETKGCTVDVQLAPGLAQVSGDAAGLRRAFQNLITNAAKHGGRGSWIGITCVMNEHEEPTMVEVQVSDRGGGIPKHELNEIWQPFFRGASALSEQVRGSGLGLSLVKEIVEAHGGMVAVESAKGFGTTFTVRLPVANGKSK